ncbi:hypothetical protein REPUB_Repub13aG0207300 [Reevesia pubescens]
MKKSGSHLLKLNFVQLFLCFLCFCTANYLSIGCSDIEKLSLISKKVSQIPLEGFLHGWVKTAANGMVLKGISSLEYLDMGWTDLSAVTDWLQQVNMLPLCWSYTFPPANSTLFLFPSHLLTLHHWGNRNSLEVLDLTENRFSGRLPGAVGNLTNMTSAVLRKNMLWGSIPESIRHLSSLQLSRLYGNPMNGIIPASIGQFSELVVMDFGQTAWKGTISEGHFSNLTKLEKLEIYSTSQKKSLTFSWGSQWIMDSSI